MGLSCAQLERWLRISGVKFADNYLPYPPLSFDTNRFNGDGGSKVQFLDKWQRSRLTSGDFICSILLDNIDHHQKQRGKVQHIDRDRDDFKTIQIRLMI